MATLFISDIHLEAGRPDISEQFFAFLNEHAPSAEALYILGDLFEDWIGDDDQQPLNSAVATAIARLASTGVRCYFVHGNRDFLVGAQFAQRAGVELLSEWTVLEDYGQRLLITHGDALCSDDIEYMNFRNMVRDPKWQDAFLARPIEERYRLAREARLQSQASAANKPMEIMDVNQTAVHEAMRAYQVTELLHGHTHRPNVHRFSLDDQPAMRVVLGDWYQHGSMVRWDQDGLELITLPR